MDTRGQKRKEYQLQWRRLNRQKLDEYERQYRAKNRERLSAKNKEYRQRNKERCHEKSRNSALLRNYGISSLDYEAMKVKQHGRCAICKEIPRRLFVDHCHDTKRVRGLLCPRCNCAIGLLKENPIIWRSICNYLWFPEYHAEEMLCVAKREQKMKG